MTGTPSPAPGDERADAANPRTIVYVANADSQDISVLELDSASGGLSLVNTVPAGGRVMPLAISPDQRWLYAGLRSEPYAVRVYAIDPGSGKLSLGSSSPLPDNMAYLATDRTGRYLFGASYSGSRISVNAIGQDSAVDPVPLAVIPTGQNAHAIATDPSNRFLFVTCLGDDLILQFRFDAATGALTPNDPPAVHTQRGAGPRHFVFHPNRQVVYCLNELDGTVNTYRFKDGGTLTILSSQSMLPDDFTGKPWAADLHLTPDSRFLYASERTGSTLAAFRVDGERGTLTVLGHYPTETQPRGFAIDPAGAYLVAAGELSHAVRVSAIDQPSGALRPVWQQEVGQDPNWVEIITLPPPLHVSPVTP